MTCYIMDKSVSAFLMISFLLLHISPAFRTMREESSDLRIHNVDTGLDYATIQEAVDANETLNGHSIRVDAGIYYENVFVNKSIRLIGEDKEKTIIDGNDTGDVVEVTVGNVTITGFTIINSEVYYSGVFVVSHTSVPVKNVNISGNIIKWNDYGIQLAGVCNNIVSENDVRDNCPGIVIDYSSNNIIFGNTLSNNREGGIRCKGHNNLIFNNKLLDNNLGISIGSYSNFNLVTSNDITLSRNVGIDIYVYSCGNVIANNSIRAITPSPYTTIGIDLSPNNDNIITGNNIFNQKFGIRLWKSNNTVISNNRILNSTENGIYLSGDCSSNILSENEISNNKLGIKLEDSSNNTVFHNNLINNTNHAYTIFAGNNSWDDSYPSGGNYWSNYTCLDVYSGFYQNETGSDGIADNPYIIDADNRDNYPLMTQITPQYHRLSEKYNELLGSYKALNATYYNLLTAYNNLQSAYNQLNSSYSTLQNSYKELQTQQNTLKNELNTIKNLTYILVTTTIILTATTIYLTKKKSKTKPQRTDDKTSTVNS